MLGRVSCSVEAELVAALPEHRAEVVVSGLARRAIS